MPRFFVVLGDNGTRKSSLVRALSGVGRRTVVDLAFHGGDEKTHVEVRSGQESGLTPQAFTALIDAQLVRWPILNVLVPFWVTGGHMKGTTYPGGNDYIDAIIHRGWPIAEIIVLGQPALPFQLPHGAPTPRFIPNSATSPANNTASQVRSWWHWI
jgi:hypothetical protein